MPLLILTFILTTFLGLSGFLEISSWNQSGSEVLMAALSMLGAIPLAAFLFARVWVRNSTRQDTSSQNFLQLVDRASSFAWFVAAIFLTLATSWTDKVQELVVNSRTVHFLVATAPAFLSLLLIWWITCWRDTRLFWDAFKTAFCRFKIQVAAILVPMCCILIIRDSAVFGIDQLPVVFQYLMLSIGLFALLVLMPFIICKILPTQSIKTTALGVELNDLANAAGARMRDIRIWDTNDRMINALVVGVLPPTRSVLLSDRLIRLFTLHEIYSVFLHEVGHARRNHLLIRFLAAGIPFLLTLLLGELLTIERSVVLLAAILVSILGLTLIARHLEFDADRFACHQLIEMGLSPDAYRSALAKIVADNPKTERHSWLHPRISTRIQRIERLVVTQPASSDA